jgi:hypothetical protein
VNTSVTQIDLEGNGFDEDAQAPVKKLLARNKCLRHLFLFDARKMLLSLMCADECGVVWPYLLDGDDLDVTAAPANVETLRAEFNAVVEERRRRELCRPVLIADVRALQRETRNQIEWNQIAEQTNQIAGLQRSTKTLVEQNQRMHEQMRQMQEQMGQMHAMLMSREQEPPADGCR